MRENEAILKDNCKYFDLGITENEAVNSMKEAQVEALKELVKRSQDNILDYTFSSGKYKTTEQIALEMIKEIEHG